MPQLLPAPSISSFVFFATDVSFYSAIFCFSSFILFASFFPALLQSIQSSCFQVLHSLYFRVRLLTNLRFLYCFLFFHHVPSSLPHYVFYPFLPFMPWCHFLIYSTSFFSLCLSLLSLFLSSLFLSYILNLPPSFLF